LQTGALRLNFPRLLLSKESCRAGGGRFAWLQTSFDLTFY
jgi:hypothetical protein